MTVFVHMPVFNGAPYLEAAIASLLSQNHGDITLHLQDDCSSDNSIEVIRNWMSRDDRIQLTVNSERRGFWYNWASGLEAASDSPFFMWASQDDVWSHDWISGCLDALRCSKYVAACGRVIPINLNGDQLTNHAAANAYHSYMASESRTYRIAKYSLSPEEFGKNNNVFSLHRTEVLGRINLWPKSSKPTIASDYLQVRKLLYFGPIAQLPKPILYKRVGSSTHIYPEFGNYQELIREGEFLQLACRVLKEEHFWYSIYSSDYPPMSALEKTLNIVKSTMRTLKRIFAVAQKIRFFMKA